MHPNRATRELTRCVENRAHLTVEPRRALAPGSGGRGTVLVVGSDDQGAVAVSRILAEVKFTVEIVADGEEALTAVAERRPDLILLDWYLPNMSGVEVCERLKQDRQTRLIPIIMSTALNDRMHRLAGINAGADDFLSIPFDPEELRARVRSLLRLKHYTDELDSAESVIRSLAMTVEARDHWTDGHCQRLAQYATQLGAAVGLDHEALAALERGGYLHDVGKVGIPDAVLLKTDRLTPEEFALMQQHTIIGERLCGDLRSLALVRPIVRSHHERLDGSGYPDGLRGEAIPLNAQIVGVVDTFDAITSARPYRCARSVDEARAELLREVHDGKFDGDLVAEFLRLLDDGVVGQASVSWTPSWGNEGGLFVQQRQYIRLRQVTNEMLAKIRYLNQIAVTQQRGLLDEDAAAQEFEVTERELHEYVGQLRASAGIVG